VPDITLCQLTTATAVDSTRHGAVITFNASSLLLLLHWQANAASYDVEEATGRPCNLHVDIRHGGLLFARIAIGL